MGWFPPTGLMFTSEGIEYLTNGVCSWRHPQILDFVRDEENTSLITSTPDPGKANCRGKAQYS
jgi:hypothetical protein